MIRFSSLAIAWFLIQCLSRGFAGEPVDKAEGEVLENFAFICVQ
jgi:hypothetical protein